MDEWLDDISDLEALEEIDRSTDELLRLLSDPYVRTTITFLYDRPDTTLEQIAGVTAAKSASESERIATPQDYDRIRHRLYHSTLPRLDDHGLIAFDPDSKTIREIDIPRGIYSVLGVDQTDGTPS